MTEDEAKRVIAVLLRADGGCPSCVGNLFNHFDNEFPEFTPLLGEAWVKEFEDYPAWSKESYQ